MEPDFVTVSCYRLSTKTEAASVVVNRNFISSCPRMFEGGDLYYAQLTMAGGETYFISEADYHRLFPQ